MEYLGAVIDVDISGFKSKISEIEEMLDQLSKSGSQEARAFASSFRDNFSKLGSQDLGKTLSNMEDALKKFAQVSSKDIGITEKAFTDLVSNAKTSLESLRRETAKGVSNARNDINSFLPDSNKIANGETWQVAGQLKNIQHNKILMAQIEETRQAREAEARAMNQQADAMDDLISKKERELQIIEEEENKILDLSTELDNLGAEISVIGNANIASDEKLSYVQNIKDALDMLSVRSDMDDESKQRIKEYNMELKIMERNLKSQIADEKKLAKELEKKNKELEKAKKLEAKEQKEGQESEGEDGNDKIKETSENVTTLAGIVKKYIVKFIPSQFRIALRAIKNSFVASGIGIAILAITAYIKKLYDWNEKLIGQKWTNFKDSVSVFFGLADATELATKRRREHRKAIEDETKAIWDNISAQQSAMTYQEKAREYMKSGEVGDIIKANLGERAWSWWGESKGEMKLHGEGNQKIWDDALGIITDPVKREQLTKEQLENLKDQVNDAIELSDKYRELEKAEKDLASAEEQARKAMELENWASQNPTLGGMSGMGNSSMMVQVSADVNGKAKAVNDARERVNAIKKVIEARKEAFEQLSELLNKQHFQIQQSNASDVIDKMVIGDLGDTTWQQAKTQIDEASDALAKFNDFRGYQIKLIQQELELRKKGVQMSGTEWDQLENLKAEYASINKQIAYLRSNGVNSKIQSDMLKGLGKDSLNTYFAIQIAEYQKQFTLLERVAEFSKKYEEIYGQDDWQIRNAEIDIKLTEDKIDALNRELEDIWKIKDANGDIINHAEKEIVLRDQLIAQLDEMSAKYQKMVLDKYVSNLNDQLSIEETLIEAEKNEIELKRRKGEIDKENAEVLTRDLDAKTISKRMEVLEAEKSRLEQLDEQCGIDEEQRKRLAVINAQLILLSSEYKLSLQAQQEEIGQTANRLKDLIDKMMTVGDYMSMLGGALSNFDNILGDVGDGISQIGSGLSECSEILRNMEENGYSAESRQQGFVQGISMAIEGVAKVYNMVRSQIEANKEAQDEWNESIQQSAHNLALMRIEEYEYQSKNIFGQDDPYAKINASLRQQSQAQKEFAEAMSKLAEEGQVQTGTKKVVKGSNVANGAGGGALAGIGTMIAIGAAAGSAATPIGTAIGAVAGAIAGTFVAIFAGKETIPVYESLTKKYGELYSKDTLELNKQMLADYDKMDDATKKLIDNAQDLLDKYKEAREEYEQYVADMAGDISSNLSDALVDAFTNNNVFDAVDTFKDYVTKQIETIVSQRVFNSVFGDMIDGISDVLTDGISGDGGYGSIEEVLAGIPSDVNGLLTTYGSIMKEFQDYFAGQGYDLFKAESSTTQDSLSGSIASMSEDTASRLNGNFMGLKLTAMEINSKMASVAEYVSISQSIMQRSLNIQTQIAENTSFCQRLDALADDIREMKLNGITVR